MSSLRLSPRSIRRRPKAYNTGGYDSPEALALLDGVVDIYMPDMKYGDSELARRYSHVRDYARVNQAAVREMHRQVGDLAMDEDGIARRGCWCGISCCPTASPAQKRWCGSSPKRFRATPVST
jgi:uncharacterized Fe-S radical SAM superfamily protein PflX